MMCRYIQDIMTYMKRKILPQDSYEIITDFLTEHKIDTVYDCTFNLYLSEKDDFSQQTEI